MDASTVRVHAAQFVDAFVKVWPTSVKTFPGSDGAFRDELSSFIVLPELDVADVRPLISKSCARMASRTKSRLRSWLGPIPSSGRNCAVRPPRDARCRKSCSRLSVLQCLGDDTSAELNRLDQPGDLMPAEKQVIRTLLERHRAHQPPQWDDVFGATVE